MSSPDRRAVLVHVGVVRTPPDEPAGRAPAGDRAGDRGCDRLVLAGCGGGRAGLRPAQSAHSHGHRPGQRHRARTPRPSRGLPVGLHTPSEVKAAITGYGAADKRQVGRHGRTHPRPCDSIRRPRMPRMRWPSPSATRGGGAGRNGTHRIREALHARRSGGVAQRARRRPRSTQASNMTSKVAA